ncbi:MAG: hypothetical protein B655_1911 [Methanobacterium sp. Maddingley MBC34]|nr:MAG: hypothetical protein B655_1911 [Methanobacterium sp. Maddingley MBC34]
MQYIRSIVLYDHCILIIISFWRNQEISGSSYPGFTGTGSGGTYPAPVLTPLFQYINPYLPFIYAISAIREIVAGVLWTNFWYSIGVLTLFPLLTVALTLLVKEKLSKTTENMEEKLKESDLFN